MTKRRAGVLGHPIAHSLSPALHRAAYAALDLPDHTYDAFDVVEADLAPFLAARTVGWVGWSLTMPLKRAVRPLLVRQSELAVAVGAVNTVIVSPDGLEGHNTDVHGMVAAFGDVGVLPLSGPPGSRRAVVLGGGATAASAVAALARLGCSEPVVHGRSPERMGELMAAAGRLGVTVRSALLLASDVIDSVATADLVVSTLPSGAADALVGIAAAARDRLPVLLDVVYDPWPTPLARAWAAVGAPVVGGLAMLVHQACGQVELMTGRRPPVDVLRRAGEAALAAR